MLTRPIGFEWTKTAFVFDKGCRMTTHQLDTPGLLRSSTNDRLRPEAAI